MMDVIEMREKLSVFRLITGVLSIKLRFILNFFNPYSKQTSEGTILITLVKLVLLACLVKISFLMSKRNFMLVAFIWSLPLSLYLLITPSIFLLFGITSFTYLLSYILMRK